MLHHLVEFELEEGKDSVALKIDWNGKRSCLQWSIEMLNCCRLTGENRYKKCCAGGILAEEDIRPQKIKHEILHGRVWREERGR